MGVLQLRIGRIAGIGRSSLYANCLIASGDSGGPLFDFEGRLIGILDASIGPELRHPGRWADAAQIKKGIMFLTPSQNDEAVTLGFTNNKRNAVDTQRHLEDSLCHDLLAPARQATVEVLIDGSPTILGTIVDSDGVVVTKRSEVMTYSGLPFGKLTCRLSSGEELAVNVPRGSFDGSDAVECLTALPLAALLLDVHSNGR